MKYYELPLLGSTRYIIPFEIEMVQLNLLLTMYYHFKRSLYSYYYERIHEKSYTQN